MPYFDVHLSPLEGMSSDVIVVDHFHPRWKEAAQKLVRSRGPRLVEACAERVSQWADVPGIGLEFSPDVGLKRITYLDASLDLADADGPNPSYRSHNVSGFPVAGAMTIIINNYISHLNHFIRED